MLEANILPVEQHIFYVEDGNFLILQKMYATFSWKYTMSVGTRF